MTQILAAETAARRRRSAPTGSARRSPVPISAIAALAEAQCPRNDTEPSESDA
ncbi:MAG: hypothetical protein R3E78_05030 [Burkholderiaceae bacterium]